MVDPSRQPTAPPRNASILRCQWLRPTLQWFWTAIVLVLALGIVTTWLTTKSFDISGTPLEWIPDHLPLVLAGGGLLIVLTAVVGYLGRPVAAPARVLPEPKDRRALIDLLSDEYHKQKAQSLQEAAMKSLEGQEPMASTLSCASLISWRMDVHGKASLAAPTSIVQAYNQASTGLLILGDPGVGKSTLLLEPAFGLLTRAVQDTTQPVPVLVNLSSWALNKPPLTIWLEEQLHSMCGIQRHWMGWMKWNRLLEPPVLHLSMTIENKRSISFASSSVLAAMSMVILAYQGQTVEDLPHLGSAEDQQRQVFEHYVTRVLEQQTGTWRYTARATRQWLIWLAQQMQQRQLTEFYLEQLQRSWLPTERAQGLYSWLFGLLFGLVYGGASFLNHYLIRLVLWQRGVMPWHYVRFLEESTERKLLQSFGGGYRFIHPLIQEYFASLGKRTSDSTQSHSSSP